MRRKINFAVSIILTALNGSHVFGSPVARKENIDTGTQESDFDTIKLQRAAKRARLAVATTSTTPPPSSATAPNDVGSSTGSTTTGQEQPAGVE